MKYLFFFFLLLSTDFLWASPVIETIQAYSLTRKTTETLLLSKAQKPTVVVFLSKDCPCSKGNLDYINELAQQFTSFRFIGIHSKKQTTPDEVNLYLQDKNIRFDVFNDPDLTIADQFKALKTPHAFILSTTGEILYNGGVTNSTFPKNAKDFFLRDAIINIQNHKAPVKTETKALGCFIVR
ncbi:MAG: redoxin domain-containing protein [Bacteriovorax sp.]|nr:redoxin domain-containing protein [Bacteriovorax sp.]